MFFKFPITTVKCLCGNMLLGAGMYSCLQVNSIWPQCSNNIFVDPFCLAVFFSVLNQQCFCQSVHHWVYFPFCLRFSGVPLSYPLFFFSPLMWPDGWQEDLILLYCKKLKADRSIRKTTHIVLKQEFLNRKFKTTKTKKKKV